MTNRISTLVLAGALLASPLFVLANDGSDDQGRGGNDDRKGDVKSDVRADADFRGGVQGFFGGLSGRGMDDMFDDHKKDMPGRGFLLGAVSGDRIAARINNLEVLIDRIRDNDRLSDDQENRLIDGIQAQIDFLEKLQARIDAGDSKADIKADLKAELKGKVLAMPKAAIESAADRVLAIVDRAETLADRLQARIDDARADGKDVSVSVDAHADLLVHLNDAKAEANAAIDLIADLSLDTNDDDAIAQNRQILIDARADIEDAYKALKAARENIKTILDDLDIDFSDVK